MATEITLDNFIGNNSIASKYEDAIKNIITEILEQGYPFSVVTQIKHISFNPELPRNIAKILNDVTLFALDGYTLNSAHIKDTTLLFEAGFGGENFGSVVSVSLGAIMQILIEDTPVFMNPCEYIEKSKDEKIEKSMNIFLSNPNNKKHLD